MVFSGFIFLVCFILRLAFSKRNLTDYQQVSFVERDSPVKIYGSLEIQKNAPWGLARISHSKRGASQDYVFDSSGGNGSSSCNTVYERC